MSDLAIELHWQRASPVLQTGAYSNEHTVQYNNRYNLPVDSAPDWGGNSDNTNPEQALASALSSCPVGEKSSGVWCLRRPAPARSLIGPKPLNAKVRPGGPTRVLKV
jgi:hypothetical protein